MLNESCLCSIVFIVLVIFDSPTTVHLRGTSPDNRVRATGTSSRGNRL